MNYGLAEGQADTIIPKLFENWLTKKALPWLQHFFSQVKNKSQQSV